MKLKKIFAGVVASAMATTAAAAMMINASAAGTQGLYGVCRQFMVLGFMGL